MSEIKITIPIPNKCLSPNARPHWAQKAKAVKELRTLAYYLCFSEKQSAEGTPWGSAAVQIVWFKKSRRKIDRDNALFSLKSVWDGFQDAEIIDNDRNFTYMPIQFEIDKQSPRVEITIKRTCTKQP